MRQLFFVMSLLLPAFSFSQTVKLTNEFRHAAEWEPIGVQIVVPPWREDICLAVARFLEDRLGRWKIAMA